MVSESDPRFAATIDLLTRIGAIDVQIRYCEEQQPLIWMVVAEFKVEDDPVYRVGAGLDPVQAAFGLADELISGWFCAHCHRPSAFQPYAGMPDSIYCLYQWQPELGAFERACA